MVSITTNPCEHLWFQKNKLITNYSKVVSVRLYGCTNRTLMKWLNKKLDGSNTKMLFPTSSGSSTLQNNICAVTYLPSKNQERNTSKTCWTDRDGCCERIKGICGCRNAFLVMICFQLYDFKETFQFNIKSFIRAALFGFKYSHQIVISCTPLFREYPRCSGKRAELWHRNKQVRTLVALLRPL